MNSTVPYHPRDRVVRGPLEGDIGKGSSFAKFWPVFRWCGAGAGGAGGGRTSGAIQQGVPTKVVRLRYCRAEEALLKTRRLTPLSGLAPAPPSSPPDTACLPPRDCVSSDGTCGAATVATDFAGLGFRD